MTLDNSDITGTIHKGERSNTGKHTRIVMLCIYFLTCYLLLLFQDI
jgi:hypothetical protein